MKIAFTICSNNYLAQAKILVDSFFEHNSKEDYIFIIGLCDRKSILIDYSIFNKCAIVEIEDLQISNFNDKCFNYNIIELNTSVKPFLFRYLFEKYDAELIYYFDPDICIFNSVSIIEEEMLEHDVLLTPHIYSPIPLDGLIPQENIFLNYGLFNLGFLALKNSSITHELLNWWSIKLETKCIDDVSNGFFVDQLPMNYVPLFFDKVLISKNYGLNMAYWNFHERRISVVNGKFKVNITTNLVFFHFSNYKAEHKDVISTHFTRFEMSDVPEISELYSSYYNRLIENKYFEYKIIPCYFVHIREARLEELRLEVLNKESLRRKIIRVLKHRMQHRINMIIAKYNQL